MARLASDTKMGFYPTSTKTIHKVMKKCIEFKNNQEIYALDCGAGEGEAIESFNLEYGCKTYAIELDEERARKATQKNIDVVLNADALSGVRKNNKWAGINFLNPPYGLSASGTRIELDFIEKWGLTTAIGGVLILVINPSSADTKMAHALKMQGYRPMYSFFDPENEDYKRFGQFFVVLQQQMPNFRASESKFMSLFSEPIDINSDIEIEKLSIRSGVRPQQFKEIDIPRWKVEESLAKSSLKKVFFDELKRNGLTRKSIENPNKGQSAILIAGGALNKEIKLTNGDVVILKGSSTKHKRTTSQIDEETGAVGSAKTVEYYKTVIYGLNLTHGQFVKYE